MMFSRARRGLAALSVAAVVLGGGLTPNAVAATPTKASIAKLLKITNTTAMSNAQYASYMKKLVAAAKAEGSVLDIYDGGGSPQANPLYQGFEKAYPWVKIQETAANTTALIERIIDEAAAHRTKVDIEQGGPEEDNSLCLERNLCAHYIAHGEKFVPKAKQFSTCGCTVADYFVWPISYNTNLVSKSDLPTSFADFTKPQWKGKFAVNVDQLDWFVAELGELGDRKGLALMRKIAANDPKIVDGSASLDNLEAGQYSAVIPGSAGSTIAKDIAKGAPVATVFPAILPAQPDMYFGFKTAPHPATERLFQEWLMSKSWQDQLGPASGKFPVLKGAPLPSFGKTVAKRKLFFETAAMYEKGFNYRESQQQKLFHTS